MGNALLVQKIQSGGDLLDYLRCLVLGEANVLLNARQQRTPVNLLEHQVELLVILEELDQLQDAQMALAVMECLHFTKDTRTRMPRYLIDHLHGVLQIGVDVDASLHRCIGSLAQNLASQLVQL